MRKYIFFIALLSLALGLKAQTFQFINEGDVINDTLYLNIASENLRIDYVSFKNLTTESKDVKIYLEKTEMANGAELFMCFENCIPDTISPTFTLEPNIEFTTFDLQYGYITDRTSVARVHLMDAISMQSLQSFVVVYKNLNISLAKPIKSNFKSSSLEVYPNPANSYTTINYTLSSDYNTGKIVIRNMIGKEVKTISINGGSSAKQVVSTSDLPNGVYFYSIVGEGQTISTKKLIVKH
ncbi:MAG: T9SS type A sorting domain-containing protein [Bacteroidales bacterium]|nr:T9SS type A sorting domain-containing protein [Bacteroidales bacterium]